MPEGRWEEAAVGRRLRLPGHFADPVVVEDVEDWGDVVQIRIRTARGEPKDATVAAEEFREALAATDDTGTSRTVPPDDQFLSSSPPASGSPTPGTRTSPSPCPVSSPCPTS